MRRIKDFIIEKTDIAVFILSFIVPCVFMGWLLSGHVHRASNMSNMFEVILLVFFIIITGGFGGLFIWVWSMFFLGEVRGEHNPENGTSYHKCSVCNSWHYGQKYICDTSYRPLSQEEQEQHDRRWKEQEEQRKRRSRNWNSGSWSRGDQKT